MEEIISVLILEDDTKTAAKLKEDLLQKENTDKVTHVSSEAEALEALKKETFDFMVLDIIMSQADGFHCMELLNRTPLESKPDVIVLSAINHETAIRKSFDLGAKYYMIKPCDSGIIYDRMMDIKNMESLPSVQDPIMETQKKSKALEHRIMGVLLSLGMPPHLKGYQYLREAIKMVVTDSSYIYNITKRLYPGIAEKFGVTPTKVELAIRHTIEVAWQRNKLGNATKIFGFDLFTKNSRPTNGELIALVADKINIELAEEE